MTKNPQFGNWLIEEDDTDFIEQQTPVKHTSRHSKLMILVNQLNTLVSKTLDDEIDIYWTAELRKKIISNKKIPLRSDSYPMGYGIYNDRNGIPCYGKLP